MNCALQIISCFNCAGVFRVCGVGGSNSVSSFHKLGWSHQQKPTCYATQQGGYNTTSWELVDVTAHIRSAHDIVSWKMEGTLKTISNRLLPTCIHIFNSVYWRNTFSIPDSYSPPEILSKFSCCVKLMRDCMTEWHCVTAKAHRVTGGQQ